MNEPRISAPIHNGQFKFLDACADFYVEIIKIKRANAEDRLADYLALADKTTASANNLARLISARLENMLRQRYRDFKREGSVAEQRIHKLGLYLMVALVDEIFILDMKWQDPKLSDAWLDVLLEEKLFKTNNAGARFFEIAKALIKSPKHSALNGELATVLLMALDLGFKGAYRGRQGQAALQKIRAQLYQKVKQTYPHSMPVDPNVYTESWSSFSQAYQHPLYRGKDLRLAPLSPWKNLGLYALAGYLLLSTICWWVLMHSFEKYIGN